MSEMGQKGTRPEWQKLGGFQPDGFGIADPEKLTFDRAPSRDSYAPKPGHSENLSRTPTTIGLRVGLTEA